jgi:hypothetical protein
LKSNPFRFKETLISFNNKYKELSISFKGLGTCVYTFISFKGLGTCVYTFISFKGLGTCVYTFISFKGLGTCVYTFTISLFYIYIDV